jgi:hypothetical protein
MDVVDHHWMKVRFWQMATVISHPQPKTRSMPNLSPSRVYSIVEERAERAVASGTN